MDSKTRLLYWLLNASRGGPTRLNVLKKLHKKPMNTRQLAMALGLDYKTVQVHVELLFSEGVILTPKKKYGSVYFISPEWEDNEYLLKLIGGNEHE